MGENTNYDGMPSVIIMKIRWGQKYSLNTAQPTQGILKKIVKALNWPNLSETFNKMKLRNGKWDIESKPLRAVVYPLLSCEDTVAVMRNYYYELVL